MTSCSMFVSVSPASSSDEVLPAFYHVTEFMESRQVGYVKAHTHLYELVKKFYTKDEVSPRLNEFPCTA